MNLTSIREAIASQFASFGLSATARIPAPTEITAPHAFISDMAMRFAAFEVVDVDMEVTVLIAPSDANTGWDTISSLLDFDEDTSIVNALLSDKTLNDTVDSVTFVEIRGLGASYDVGGVSYLGFQMAFTVHV